MLIADLREPKFSSSLAESGLLSKDASVLLRGSYKLLNLVSASLLHPGRARWYRPVSLDLGVCPVGAGRPRPLLFNVGGKRPEPLALGVYLGAEESELSRVVFSTLILGICFVAGIVLPGELALEVGSLVVTGVISLILEQAA